MEHLIEQLMGQLRGMVRWRWFGCVAAWMVAVVGWTWVYTLPDVYRSYSRIYVDTQTLLNPLLSGLTVRPDTQQQVRLMARTLLSRPNLEEVIRRADLDHDVRDDKDMHRLIDDVGEHLALGSSGRENLYELSYTGESPALATRVVREAVNLFMERGLGETSRDLKKSQDFIEAQLRSYEARLVETEQRLEQFKREHAGMMGNEGRDYYGRREAARATLEQAQLQLQEARGQLNTYRRQTEGNEPLLLFSQNSGMSADPELAQRILALEKNLDSLLLRYKDEHPDVVATRRLIEKLRAREPSGPDMAAGAQSAGMFAEQMNIARAEAEARVAALETRVAAYATRYKKMAEAVDQVPAIEREYSALARDHQVLQTNYDELLATREKASISQDVENKTTAVEFRIIDPPTVPISPAAPNRLILTSALLLLAIGSGLGTAFLLAQLRPTIDSTRLLEELTGRPEALTVSTHATASNQRLRRRSIASYSFASLALFGAYSAALALNILR